MSQPATDLTPRDAAPPRLVLASASPRRRELLAQIGVTPDAIAPADIDETPHPREAPRVYVARMADEKAAAALERLGPAEGRDEIILAADTVVAAGRRILGKPADAAEAEQFLRLLSGRRHQVMTAVTLRRRSDKAAFSRLVGARVKLKRLSEDDIAWYLRSEEWRGKAGGYAIQGAAARFAPWISGSYTAIVGLPVAETAALLEGAGLRGDLA